MLSVTQLTKNIRYSAKEYLDNQIPATQR